MPNNVRHKLQFESRRSYQMACAVLEGKEGGERFVDFGKIVPEPITMYQGDTSGEDEKDFGQHTWREWRIANWGTKWGAYESEFNDDEFWIKFETAWSVPYPIITAVANTLKHSSFVHIYICEYGEFFATEVWQNQKRILRDKDFMKVFLEIYGQERFDEIQQEYTEDNYQWPSEKMLSGDHGYF